LIHRDFDFPKLFIQIGIGRARNRKDTTRFLKKILERQFVVSLSKKSKFTGFSSSTCRFGEVQTPNKKNIFSPIFFTNPDLPHDKRIS